MALGVKIAVAIATKIAEKDRTAKSIRIFEIEGTDVTMTKGGNASFPARVDRALANGYTVTTGKNSYSWLDLDEKKFIKMDQNTTIRVDSNKLKQLVVSVLKGSITLKDDGPPSKGDLIKVRAGNTALGGRG